jgi:hypothetical protein
LPAFRFAAEVIHWRGPSPFFFAPVPAAEAAELRRLMRAVTYGWGMIPVEAQIGGVTFTTSLFPKDDTYLLPLKDAVRRKAGVTAGDVVTVEMALRPPRR